MNSCILMAEIYDTPQLRHTPDGLEVTEMIVHVPGVRPDDPSHPLKVVGWGNLAKEIHQTYKEGDRVIIEGRLGMNTFDRPEGFKEKRAELTVQKIHGIGKEMNSSPPATTMAQPAQRPPESYESTRPAPTPVTTNVAVTPQVTTPEPTYQPANFQPPSYQPVSAPEPDPDDIPF
ncbi:single-stranded DNA-binding protein [Anabaena cylindrica FACHB-243]|uniref:Single-strand binding protein n=1 Tax=Anabaena cylindrica (strain ATCC 27899 / PCC 7122) TaxID=272123 RepID=K9ZAG6_ANACC|nr:MULTISPECIES: single-stranded DNA-binding protein [Anabaena]AFZ55704.1 single-strand binding protein [Anabaena cylindrica PCC 7122]MBD2420291.1 single-stranded DNA-binding protein [Anabaena cylindrica FACHB-243]MBY5282095.1 single-stranded DNA-binding protein [Anabaena sp. CCAP 1446/1C]MBY5309608.1 single-stranded DNA-binding protein [Anabaena sp. CCAP 1446/1C]MCM2406054.1 single-stranded DNA-binding protein [Anabaena sp. CCAP 1446/1C]